MKNSNRKQTTLNEVEINYGHFILPQELRSEYTKHLHDINVFDERGRMFCQCKIQYHQVRGLKTLYVELAKAGLGKGADVLGGLLGSAADGASKVGEKLGPMLRDGLAQAQDAIGKGFDFFKGLLGDAKDEAAKIGATLGPALKEGLELARQGLGKGALHLETFHVVRLPAVQGKVEMPELLQDFVRVHAQGGIALFGEPVGLEDLCVGHNISVI